jgi:hypothetical protein
MFDTARARIVKPVRDAAALAFLAFATAVLALFVAVIR